MSSLNSLFKTVIVVSVVVSALMLAVIILCESGDRVSDGLRPRKKVVDGMLGSGIFAFCLGALVLYGEKRATASRTALTYRGGSVSPAQAIVGAIMLFIWGMAFIFLSVRRRRRGAQTSPAD